MTVTAPDPRMPASLVNSGRLSVRAAAQINPSNGVAREAQFIRQKDLIWRQLERVIRRIGEEVAEEVANGPSKVDLAHANEQTDFPDDRHGRATSAC